MKKRILCMLLAIVMVVGCVGILSACKKKTTECTTHVDENKDGKCDECGKVMTEVCNHKDANGDKVCDICGKKMGEDEVIVYPWDTTDLVFQMTENTHEDQLSSTCKAYLAGETSAPSFAGLDTSIKQRNANAVAETKVNVTYKYYGTSDDYGWSKIVDVIYAEWDSNRSADMYVNFLRKMSALSLKGCFANLLAETDKNGANVGNYFEFVKDGYREPGQEFPTPENDKGFMYEFMRSTTLSKHKMYILASDYFTDSVRAFYSMPVNVQLLTAVGMDITGDLDHDGKFTLNDFYEDVYANNWTYNRLAEYAATYSSAGSGTTQTLDDTIGFALSNNGLPASGILYSTDITVVERQYLPDEDDYKYSYPVPEHQNALDLITLTNNITTLMKKPGCLVISESNKDLYNAYGTLSIKAIRNRFSANTILFGGIEMIGAYEEPEYQTLISTGEGFGIVPVPLYKEVGVNDTETYLTGIHVVGRVGAISSKTRNFSQCTAFLNYQSTHSDEVLTNYYEYLQNIASGGDEGTVEMLDFIRNHVRSSFDKLTEDAISDYFGEDNAPGWHKIMGDAEYNLDITAQYSSIYENKQSYLVALMNTYNTLPEYLYGQ